MDFSIVVLSCDKYNSTWPAFFGLLNRYYSNHPKTYLITETKKCSLADETINIDSDIWSERIREGLKQVQENYVLIMLDDFFLRAKVDEDRIKAIKFKNNDIVYNFEKKYRECQDNNEWALQFQNQMYLNSCQPSLWDKERLINSLSKNQNPWEWEMTIVNSEYNYYLNNGSTIMDIGMGVYPWGITKGQITRECQTALNTEGFPISISSKKLSIITPYYKTLKEIRKLAEVLEPQLTEEVEWLIVDDGCKESSLDSLNARVFHLNNNSKGASKPRNIALDNAVGEYVVFIDSDDLITTDYIDSILNKIDNSEFDYCYFSWEYINKDLPTIIIENEPPEWNKSIWNCIYKKDLIGTVRFDETKRFAEDAIFNYQVRKGKKEILNKVLYLYNTSRIDNLSSLMKGD